MPPHSAVMRRAGPAVVRALGSLGAYSLGPHVSVRGPTLPSLWPPPFHALFPGNSFSLSAGPLDQTSAVLTFLLRFLFPSLFASLASNSLNFIFQPSF